MNSSLRAGSLLLPHHFSTTIPLFLYSTSSREETVSDRKAALVCAGRHAAPDAIKWAASTSGSPPQPQWHRESWCWILRSNFVVFSLWWRTHSSRQSMTSSSSPLRKMEVTWSSWRRRNPLTPEVRLVHLEVILRTREAHWMKSHRRAAPWRKGDLNFLITLIALPFPYRRGKKKKKKKRGI